MAVLDFSAKNGELSEGRQIEGNCFAAIITKAELECPALWAGSFTVGKRVDVRRMLNPKVELKELGYVAGSEAMAKVYSAADLFCITPLDDNFPTTVLESLACGTPVAGFRVGGIPEQVTEDCGVLVAPRDAKALGVAITRLLQDDELREIMSMNSRARAVSRYSVEEFRDRYAEVYHELVQGGAR